MASSLHALQILRTLVPRGLLGVSARRARGCLDRGCLFKNSVPCLQLPASPRCPVLPPNGVGPALTPAPWPLGSCASHWPLGSRQQGALQLSSEARPEGRHLGHLWEARHAGGSACGRHRPPPENTPSHGRRIEAPASREVGWGGGSAACSLPPLASPGSLCTLFGFLFFASETR